MFLSVKQITIRKKAFPPKQKTMHTFICSHQKNGASNLCSSLLMLLSPSSSSFHTPPFYLSSYFKHPNLPPSHSLLLHLLPSFLILSFVYLLFLLPATSNAYLLASAVLPHPACAACEGKSSPSLGLHTALSIVAGNTNTYYLLCDLLMN